MAFDYTLLRTFRLLTDPSRARQCVLGLATPEETSREVLLGLRLAAELGDFSSVSKTITDVLTPLDVEIEYRIRRSSQKKSRANGSFAPYFEGWPPGLLPALRTRGMDRRPGAGSAIIVVELPPISP